MASMDTSVLDKRCSFAHIAKISEDIEDWEKLAPCFDLTAAEEHAIRVDHTHQYDVQKRKMLWKWVEKRGDKATYRELKRVFQNAGESLLACRVDELLQDTYSQSTDNVVNSFQEYLKDCYCNNPVTYHGQKIWPPQLSQSPFVKPELVLKPKSHLVSKQAECKQSFNIEDLCSLDKKVMIEGIAGSGKTTLTRHICQQWAEGELLRGANLVIHLTLADPALWSAKSLEDMIPHPSAEMRKTVAKHIVEQRGSGCCFILDGWEDLPEESSFVQEVVEGKKLQVALPHCFFIVTSRPFASHSLQLLVSTTVEITGFSHESVDTYATQYLTQVGRDPTVFITALNDNHHARRLCSLPINAAILLYLFLTIETGLPTTQTELFKCFILNLLLRHLVTKVGQKVRKLREFSDLPPNEKQVFDNLCLIAHYSTFNGKAASQSNQLLSSDDLQKAGLHDIQDTHDIQVTLGLMKVHQQLTWCGLDPHYGFLHSSVQDFLCALRMSQLGPEEQVRDFNKIVNTNPTSLVLLFYAGLTKLENKSVCQILCDLGKNPPSFDCIHRVYAAQCAGGDPRRQFLAYLHCLYEANIPDVLVKPEESKESKSLYVIVDYQLYRPTIHDLNVISYYILSIARVSHPTGTLLSFSDCFVDDHGIETIVANITKQAQSQQSTLNGHLTLTIGSANGCTYTHRGVRALASLITLNSVPLVELRIQCGNFSSLKVLIEAFSSPTAVNYRGLNLSNSGLTSRHAYHLILLLTQARYLWNFDISMNPGLQGALPLLLSAARNLNLLSFSDIPIDDQELLETARILQSNTSLKQLDIESTSTPKYTPESVIEFVKIVTAPDSKSQLQLLVFDQYKENEAVTLFSYELIFMAKSRGRNLVVQPAYMNTEYSELQSSEREKILKACEMHDSLLSGKE